MAGLGGGALGGLGRRGGGGGEGGQVKAEVITGRRTPPVFPSALALYHEAAAATGELISNL